MKFLSELSWSHAQVADAPAMLDIYNEFVKDGGHVPMLRPATLDSIQSMVQFHRTYKFPMWTIWFQDQMVAWANLRPITWGFASTLQTGELCIYVTEKWHKRGAAVLAVFLAHVYAPPSGFEIVTCWILGCNPSSIRLTQSCGLKRWGTLPHAVAYGSLRHDLQIWGIELNDMDWRTNMDRLQKRLFGADLQLLQKKRADSVAAPPAASSN